MHRMDGQVGKSRGTRVGRLERSAKRGDEHPLPQDVRLSFSFSSFDRSDQTHRKLISFPNQQSKQRVPNVLPKTTNHQFSRFQIDRKSN